LDTCHGQVGGTELNTLHLARQMVARGYEPVIAEIGKTILGPFVQKTGVTTVHIGATSFSDVGWQEWRNVFTQVTPDVVVRSKGWWQCINWRLDLLALWHGATYVGWEHHPAERITPERNTSERHTPEGHTHPAHRIPSFLLRWKRRVRWSLHRRAVSRSIAVSQAVREPLIAHHGLAPHKVVVIYPGVDFSEFTVRPGDKRSLRTHWGVPPDAKVIGSLGRLVPHKQNEIVLHVLNALLHAAPTTDYWAVIAGTGPDLARLEELARQLGVAHRVRFPGWQERASSTWNALDVFLMTSNDEGLGMSLIEAVACGCIPLAAATGGMLEILSGPLEAYRVEPPHLAQWVAMTDQVLAEPDDVHALRVQAAIDAMRARFDATQQFDRMIDGLIPSDA
jgi:glycosyltransferase involved in cell wall biosynthesis